MIDLTRITCIMPMRAYHPNISPRLIGALVTLAMLRNEFFHKL